MRFGHQDSMNFIDLESFIDKVNPLKLEDKTRNLRITGNSKKRGWFFIVYKINYEL